MDNIGNDLTRFISLVIKRPTLVSGNSSGGIAAAWLSAYGLPGQTRASLLEDPPLFSSEVRPRFGHSIRQGRGPMFALFANYLGDQWKVGDWEGLRSAIAASDVPLVAAMKLPPAPPENLADYDPEWARASWDGSMLASCAHDRMLAQMKTPVLITQHFSKVDPDSGDLLGALSDLQLRKAEEIIAASGARIEVRKFPEAAHAMHAADPDLFAKTLTEWAATLPS